MDRRRPALYMMARHRPQFLAWCVASLVLLCCLWQAALGFGNHASFKATGVNPGRSRRHPATSSQRRRRASRDDKANVSGRHTWHGVRQASGTRSARESTVVDQGGGGQEAGTGAEAVAGAGAEAETSSFGNLVMERPIARVVLPEGRGLRVHCMSDLHTDIKGNFAW